MTENDSSVASERRAALIKEYEFLDEFGNVWRQTLDGPTLVQWRCDR